MATNEKLEEVLNDLIEINTDRITGYEKASKETKDVDVDLQAIFNKMADESRQYKAQLTQEVSRLGEKPVEGRTKLGSIFQVWMDVKAAITSNDRKSVLSSCEFGEDKAKQTYDDVMEDVENLPSNAITIIKKQRSELQKAHDEVKALRDSSK